MTSQTPQEFLQSRMDSIRAVGIAYPNDFRPTHNTLVSQLTVEDDVRVSVTIAGRVRSRRGMGKMAFFDLQDTHGRLQCVISSGESPDAMDIYNTLTIGDIVGVQGYMFKTRQGEISVRVESLRLLTPTQVSVPDHHTGLSDTQTRYRHRELDLVVNREVFDRFRTRSQIVRCVREYLERNSYMEVETPMLMAHATGASARPFVTHHNALGQDMVLRIAPELALKRLVVGGFDRVFELNRNFRNEGVSTRHNPEFTMMEVYQAYGNYVSMMDLCENLIRHCAMSIRSDDNNFFNWGDVEIDISQPFRRVSMIKCVSEVLGCSTESLENIVFIQSALRDYSIDLQDHKVDASNVDDVWGRSLNALFEAIAEPTLSQPTFITHYPLAVSPLARCFDDNKRVTERFELFVAGRELANGFSELNDPQEQASRFDDQRAKGEAGDDEAMGFDDDYIQALSLGLAPCGGLGIGIDRLVMWLTNQASIREVVLFPSLRA